jgi:hypothetical protein
MKDTLVFSDLLNGFDNNRVAYCYQGENTRGQIAICRDGELIIIRPQDYIIGRDYINIEDNSKFELWCFIDDMDNNEVRQEAINRLFSVYCNLYYHMSEFQDYEFKLN